MESLSGDPVMREAVENQIRHFGQTPSQVRTMIHEYINQTINLHRIIKSIFNISLHSYAYFLNTVIDGAASSSIFSNAFVTNDVFTSAWWCVHDHEVSFKLTDLPYYRKYVPPTTPTFCCHSYCKSTFCSEPMEHELLRWDKILQSSDLYMVYNLFSL